MHTPCDEISAVAYLPSLARSSTPFPVPCAFCPSVSHLVPVYRPPTTHVLVCHTFFIIKKKKLKNWLVQHMCENRRAQRSYVMAISVQTQMIDPKPVALCLLYLLLWIKLLCSPAKGQCCRISAVFRLRVHCFLIQNVWYVVNALDIHLKHSRHGNSRTENYQ